MSANRLQDIENTSVARNVQPYSKFVRALRIFLPVGILAIIAILVLWPLFKDMQTTSLTNADLSALKKAETQNTLLNPTFNTQDANGKLVTIQASEATQNKSTSNLINLKGLSAQMDEGDKAIQFKADSGVYDQGNKTITLNNNVEILGADNTTLKTDGLEANIETGIAKSTSPAILQTEQGVIEGQSVIINQNDQTTTFQGPAKAVINP